MSQATSITPSIQCPSPVLPAGAQGIARVAVDDAHSQLVVTFLAPISQQQSYLLERRSYSLTGGKRLFPRIVSAAPYPPGSPPTSPPGSDPQSVLLTLDTLGDFSIYTLTVSGPDVDPFFSSVKIRFRLACDDFFDCRPPAAVSAPQSELPVTIDYLTKDYAGFRQALLDFIPTRFPQWTERSEADLGMMLLELFAATADNLSYTQDRVANEAFLSTATQRRSVAGHLALIGYQMDEGASAYTWLHFEVSAAQILPAAFKVSNNPTASDDPIIVFETMTQRVLDPALNSMFLFDWGNRNCCLPKNATNATLAGNFGSLNVGDALFFDDGGGQPDVVRLTALPKVYPAPGISSPPVTSPPSSSVTVVTWSPATPLRHDYCVANTTVRGNIVLATHGETIEEEVLRDSQPAGTSVAPVASSAPVPRLRLPLSLSPLGHIDPYVDAFYSPVQQDPSMENVTADLTARTPRSISSLVVKVDGQSWQQVTSLLGSNSADRVYKVDIEDDGQATVVFGNGTFGQRPAANARITARYRVGGGTVGNVGLNTLTKPYPSDNATWLISVTNPLPAAGGRDRESADHARRFAPPTFHQPLVAVSAADYQNAALMFTTGGGQKAIQRANASFRWTGSWLTVTLTVDPLGTGALTPDLRQSLLAYLETRRLVGYDLEILPPVDVPVDLAIQFTAVAGSEPATVQQSLLQSLSNGVLADGSKAFFHPDNFTFGQNLFVSKIYEAVLAVPGVSSAQITELARSHSAQRVNETMVNLANGFLAVGTDQVIRLDNDRNFPQNGTLTIIPQGVQS